jgi:hypothetical protein
MPVARFVPDDTNGARGGARVPSFESRGIQSKGDNLRVVAAKFPDRERAAAALDSLHRELNNGLTAEIAPLASDAQPGQAAAVLAGHFREEQAPAVAQIVTASGGEIVADVDESWTRPRFAHEAERSDETGEGTGFSW